MFKSLQKIQKLGRGTEKGGFQKKKEKEKSFYLHVSGFRKYNFELKSKGENDRTEEVTEGRDRRGRAGHFRWRGMETETKQRQDINQGNACHPVSLAAASYAAGWP